MGDLLGSSAPRSSLGFILIRHYTHAVLLLNLRRNTIETVLPAVCAMAVHIPSTIFLVGHLGFAGAGWAVVVMRTAHLGFTIGKLTLMLMQKGGN